MLEKAPNGVLAPAATKQGIEACNAQGLINFTRLTSANFADKVSSTIRIGLSKFRDVRDSGKMLQATERKLGSSAYIKKLQSILDMMIERTTTSPSPSPSPNSRTAAVYSDGFPDFSNILSARSDSTIAYSDEAGGNDQQQMPSTGKTQVDTAENNGTTAQRSMTCADLLIKAMGMDPVTPKQKRGAKADIKAAAKSKGRGRGRGSSASKGNASKRTGSGRGRGRGRGVSATKSADGAQKKKSKNTSRPRAATVKAREQDVRKRIHSKAYHKKKKQCEEAGHTSI